MSVGGKSNCMRKNSLEDRRASPGHQRRMEERRIQGKRQKVDNERTERNNQDMKQQD